MEQNLDITNQFPKSLSASLNRGYTVVVEVCRSNQLTPDFYCRFFAESLKYADRTN